MAFMRTATVICILIASLILAGCGNSSEQEAPNLEQPSVPEVNGQVTVEEDVIVPSHVPEPEEEPEEPVKAAPKNLLEDHADTVYFSHGRPGVGAVTSMRPRKVDLVFTFPLKTTTTVEVWDDKEVVRYDIGDVALGDPDLVVAIKYFGEELLPGTYKVKYHAEFVGKEAKIGDGYYYFKVE